MDHQQINHSVIYAIEVVGYFVDRTLNHPVFITLIGPIAAAFFGTWGAQKLAERQARRKELILQINGINLAIAYTVGIVQTFINFKKQIVLPTSNEYKKTVSERNAFLTSKSDSIPPKFHCILKMKNFHSVWTPIEDLKGIFSSKFVANSNSLLLLVRLSEFITILNEFLLQRNDFISEYRKMPMSEDDKASLYFGELISRGHIDERYKNLMKIIPETTDDCIGFAVVLYETLYQIGTKASAQLKKRGLHVYKTEFLYKELIPDLEKYYPLTGKNQN
ncbi:MAG: hypothetical protein KGH75_08180 [Rhodospirillales bacterium]|nr:hypothetical protein [Rhodospirillales bacterium]